MCCKWLWFFAFHLLPTCVGSHSSGEKKPKNLYFNLDFAWHLNLFCFDFQFEAVLRHVLRLSLVRWMHKAGLIFKASQHKLRQVLPELIGLSCNGLGWEGICATGILDPPSQLRSHLLSCRRFAAGPHFAAQ